jgi:hypothetical protein
MWEGVEVMKFKVGDKVVFKNDTHGNASFVVESWGRNTQSQKYKYYVNDDWHEEDDLEPIKDPLATKIEERNNKPQKTEEPWLEEYFEVLEEEAAIRPTHYQNTNGNGKDLFDEWYERYYHSNKRFTGREVFIEIMKSVAERYIRRYPNKNDEDILKGIETLTRLKQMEELEEEDAKN